MCRVGRSATPSQPVEDAPDAQLAVDKYVTNPYHDRKQTGTTGDHPADVKVENANPKPADRIRNQRSDKSRKLCLRASGVLTCRVCDRLHSNVVRLDTVLQPAIYRGMALVAL